MYCGNFIGDITQYKNIENLLHISSQVTLVQRDNKVVHGTNVEDGTLQGYLKMFNIPYVGSDVIASACGMDKYVCKCLLKDNDIPVLDCKCFTLNDYNENLENIINTVEKEFPYPVIVKPVNLGSSVGIQIAEVSECEEPIKTDEILSFNDKYIYGGKKMGGAKSMNAGVLKLLADISTDVRQTIQELSIKTFKVLGCSGVIRIDFIMV